MKPALAYQWEDITIAEALAEAVDRMFEAGVASSHLDARLLMSHVLEVSREYLTLNSEAYLSEMEWDSFDELVERRVNREPMSHILGTREFWSLNFTVTPETLDPRPDSETVIESVLAYVPRKDARLMIADFGTGTGCLLLSLLSEYGQSHGLGVDFSEAALKVAERNAQSLGLSTRTHFHHTSWGEGVIGRYDVIVSNPPYIPDADIETLEPEVAEYEPKLALSGGIDGLDAYRELLPHMKRLLAPQGVAVLECGIGQAGSIKKLAEACGLQTLEIVQDLGGVDRCLVLSHQV